VSSGEVLYKSRTVRCCRDRSGCFRQYPSLLLSRMCVEWEVWWRGQFSDGFLEDGANVV